MMALIRFREPGAKERVTAHQQRVKQNSRGRREAESERAHTPAAAERQREAERETRCVPREDESGAVLG